LQAHKYLAKSQRQQYTPPVKFFHFQTFALILSAVNYFILGSKCQQQTIYETTCTKCTKQNISNTFSFYRDATKIIVRGNSSDFMARNNYDLNGKEAHIADVLTSLYNTRQEIIKPKEVILFDDDDENIAKAKEFKHWAVEVKDSISYDTFIEISSMFTAKGSK
jgi:hypothetical protein